MLGSAGLVRPLSAHLQFARRMSHRLALALFFSAARHRTKLAFRQQLLSRLVDIGADLFAMVAVCAKAGALIRRRGAEQSPIVLADLFCRQARRRIRQTWRSLRDHDDHRTYRVAQDVLNEKMLWLEDGIL
jgi:hypothetical protein